MTTQRQPEKTGPDGVRVASDMSMRMAKVDRQLEELHSQITNAQTRQHQIECSLFRSKTDIDQLQKDIQAMKTEMSQPRQLVLPIVAPKAAIQAVAQPVSKAVAKAVAKARPVQPEPEVLDSLENDGYAFVEQ